MKPCSPKICPECTEAFTKRRKGCCPHCDIPLFIDAHGKIRVMADKDCVDTLLYLLRLHQRQRTGIDNPLELSEYSTERVFAYQLLERAKRFMSAQRSVNLDFFSPHLFLMGLINFCRLKIPWWRENLKSLNMLSNKISEIAAQYFQYLKNKLSAIRAEQQRIQYQTPEMSHAISYGL